MKVLLAVLMIAHGLIVAAQASGSFRPVGGVANPAWLSWWPSGLGQSWLLAGIEQSLPVRLGGVVWLAAGMALVAAGLGLLGVAVPFERWRSLALAGSALSLAMLLIYLHPFYLIGLGSSAALLAALIWKGWPVLQRLGV